MTARTPSTRAHDLLAPIAAMIVTVAAWQMLSRAAASLLVSAKQPEAALVFYPSNGVALADLAEIVIARRPGQKASGDEVKKANAQSAERLTDRAIARAPLDTTVLSVGAQSAEMLGNTRRADTIMNLAGTQTIRDPIVNLYLLKQAADAKDFAKALYRADALLRVSPGVASDIYPLLDALAQQEGARNAFVATLGAGPPWRAGFLASVASKVDDPTSFFDVVLALRAAPVPLSDVELRAFLDPLIQRALVEQAYYVWLQYLPPKLLEALPLIYNGDFVYKLTNLPFDWTVIPIEGATTTFEPIQGEDRRRLSIQFDGKRVPFVNVVQMLLLPAGKYRFTGLYKTDGLSNPRGMTWRLYCAERNDAIPIGETERVSGTSDGWKTFETAFDVPTQTCSAQWLRLELAARVSIEEAVSGSVSYTDLKIDRVDGTEIKRVTAPGISLPAQPGTAFERAVRGR